MRILVVSWYFPPFNTMGALRVGKFCKYLHAEGHDVRVLSCADLPFDRTLPLEFPEDRIRRTAYTDVNALPKAAQKLRVALGLAGRKRPTEKDTTDVSQSAAEIPRAGTTPGILRRIRNLYVEALNLPDPQIGWLPYGIHGGRRLLSHWRPEIVFASAPPFTTLLVARSLARRFRIPWVAEYRDRFFEDPYSPPSGLRRAVEKRLENRWLRDVSGIVTVSDPWAEDYRARFGLPVETVYNGFDADEFPLDDPRAASDPAVLRIVYTGILYPERRDPTPLFEAIRLLGTERDAIRVAFYGADPVALRGMAARHGVDDLVEIHDRIPYRASLDMQMNADVLLLLQWNDPRERGNVPGKLFEYIGARRPVLGIGVEDGVPATILRARGIGRVLNDPQEIAQALKGWLAEKRSKSGVLLLPPSVREGLSRADQFGKLVDFLARFAAPARTAVGVDGPSDHRKKAR